MQLNGSQIVIECLKEQRVDTVFGYPGGAILNLYDELYMHRDEIHHVLTSHEQGAAHAADGYARATGKVGVCLATSGPGATNLVTGIATAYMDSVPMVAITCNVGLALLGKDSFQEVDIAGITMPVTKHNFIVKDVEDLAPTLRRAFAIAGSGRPGPVLVDIPKNVTSDVAEFSRENPKKIEPVTKTIQKEDLERAVAMITEAKKPYIFVGGGAVISGAKEELAEFVELVDAPVCDTLMGKGAYDGRRSNYTGMLGMHGTKVSNLGVSRCDLLIAVGTRFSDRIIGNPETFAKEAKILQFDIDPVEVNKNIVVDAQVLGDIRAILRRLNPLLPKMDHCAWRQEIHQLEETYPMMEPGEGVNGPYAIRTLYEKTKGDAVIATEVGQHQMWAAQYFRFQRPRQLITSGGCGTMGYGLGASIGASIGLNKQRVFNIAGDGCFRMNMNELATAKREGVPVVEIIMNNHALGMVRQWQTLFYNKHYSGTVLEDEVDYVKLAEAFGVRAVRAKTRAEYEVALDEALDTREPMLIDLLIGQDDKVWPMVAPGTSISDCFGPEERSKE